MLDFIDVRVVAAVQVLMALVIAWFWITWFRSDHDAPWLPEGYLQHERCFVYPDSVLVVLLVISAILLFSGNPLGERLTLVCGGMTLFLALIDLAYFWQNNLFAKERGGMENVILVAALGFMSLLMIFRFI